MHTEAGAVGGQCGGGGGGTGDEGEHGRGATGGGGASLAAKLSPLSVGTTLLLRVTLALARQTACSFRAGPTSQSG